MKTTHFALSALFITLATNNGLGAYPPDNAAVLYYRSFMVIKEPNKAVQKAIEDFRKNKIESNKAIRRHLALNAHVIELLETAADIPRCDWGRDESKGFDLLLPELSKMRQNTYLLDTEAKRLKEERKVKKALDKYLTMHKLARHVGDDLLISYLVGVSIGTLANEGIQAILPDLLSDAATLTWLKSQLVDIATSSISIKAALSREKEIAMKEIRHDKVETILAALGSEDAQGQAVTDAIAKVRQGDERFFSDSRRHYARVMTDVIMALDLPYDQSQKRLSAIIERIEKDAKTNPTAILTAIVAPGAAKVTSVHTRNVTFANAIQVALEIYTVKAKTGRLPDTLPHGLPIDLFSGKAFVYQKISDGFLLRCQAKDLSKDKVHEYRFGVKN